MEGRNARQMYSFTTRRRISPAGPERPACAADGTWPHRALQERTGLGGLCMGVHTPMCAWLCTRVCVRMGVHAKKEFSF